MEFRNLTLNDKQYFDEILSCGWEVNNDFFGSENVFENLFIWNNNNISICVTELAIYLEVKLDGRKYFLAPIARNEKDFISAFEKMLDYSIQKKVMFAAKCVSHQMFEILEQSGILNKIGYSAEIDLANGEYCYEPQDLITYAGKKMSKKRNHYNKFSKLYDFKVIEYNSSYANQVKELFKTWCDSSETCTGCEECALMRTIDNYEKLNLKGTLIFVEDKLVAFAFGVITFANIGIELFEKADTSYDGVYAVICSEFSKMHFQKVRYINRQEDMGIGGLRKSKMSYNPIFMTREYTIMEI